MNDRLGEVEKTQKIIVKALRETMKHVNANTNAINDIIRIDSAKPKDAAPEEAIIQIAKQMECLRVALTHIITAMDVEGAQCNSLSDRVAVLEHMLLPGEKDFLC